MNWPVIIMLLVYTVIMLLAIHANYWNGVIDGYHSAVDPDYVKAKEIRKYLQKHCSHMWFNNGVHEDIDRYYEEDQRTDFSPGRTSFSEGRTAEKGRTDFS